MGKSSLTVDLDDKVKQVLEKRAKKEMLTLRELVSDILRRSAISYKGNPAEDRVDDKFLSYFSRRRK